MTRFFRLGILVAVLAAYPAGLLLSQESGQSVHLSFAEQYRTYDSEHPGVPIGPGYSIQQRSLGKATTGLTREVFGYLPYWFRDRWNLLDYGLVSTIAYFSGEAASDGTIGNTHGWPTYPGDPTAHASVINMINRAHANGVRVVLCITNFDGNAIHSIVTNPAYSATLIEQAFALVQAGNADGVNINF